jgi:hypothetical protein
LGSKQSRKIRNSVEEPHFFTATAPHQHVTESCSGNVQKLKIVFDEKKPRVENVVTLSLNQIKFYKGFNIFPCKNFDIQCIQVKVKVADINTGITYRGIQKSRGVTAYNGAALQC